MSGPVPNKACLIRPDSDRINPPESFTSQEMGYYIQYMSAILDF